MKPLRKKEEEEMECGQSTAQRLQEYTLLLFCCNEIFTLKRRKVETFFSLSFYKRKGLFRLCDTTYNVS